ncbi:hypothetical protein EV702DRAFT_1205389 [Suillus placidus]|uniref:Uncharacterized protein n=1 Tax=Suillus placidus TaxID=48579 RepID=A0A9P7CWG8_9AGAM|nr:hypothetical protein EV702DRAFT_1205389 [Suillus placidus]
MNTIRENLPGISGSAFLQIMAMRMGTPAALFLWSFVCLTAFFVSQTTLQACSHTVYAFSHDNLATISFAFSIMGLCSSIATTLNTPLLLGGPASVTWCWLLGSFTMCFTLGSSIAEIVSAFPTCGGLYTASAQLCPKSHRAIVGWIIGWLNILGQVAGLSSTEFGLANMIWAAVSLSSPTFQLTQGKTVGLFAGLLIVHGLLNWWQHGTWPLLPEASCS